MLASLQEIIIVFTITVIMVTIKISRYDVHDRPNHDHGHHLIELVLIEDDVEHLWRALGKLLRRHQLHVDVPGLGLQTHHIVITFYPTQGKNLSLLSDSHRVNHT